MLNIYFLYANNCSHCDQAIETLRTSIKKCKNIPCQITKLLYDTPEALKIAIDNGIDDLPGFVIGKKSFKGGNYTEATIVEAIKKYGKVGNHLE